MVPEGFHIDPDTYTALMSTIESDCSLLESNDNMDYSLLLGVHNLDEAQRELNSTKLVLDISLASKAADDSKQSS